MSGYGTIPVNPIDAAQYTLVTSASVMMIARGMSLDGLMASPERQVISVASWSEIGNGQIMIRNCTLARRRAFDKLTIETNVPEERRRGAAYYSCCLKQGMCYNKDRKRLSRARNFIFMNLPQTRAARTESCSPSSTA